MCVCERDISMQDTEWAIMGQAARPRLELDEISAEI